MSSTRLEDQARLDELGEHAREILEIHWTDASRVFSPRALEAYLEGAISLQSLGRGEELVLAYIEATPQVARELGVDTAFELLSMSIKMFSKTSSAVLTLLFSTAPVAANRLGEASLFQQYLSLVNYILSQAPRALRPMLGQLDHLLEVLTLGGLRRWATWGINAHRTDFEALEGYFSLASPDAEAVLQKERRGTLFVDVQRRLVMYLRALWARNFLLRPTSGDFESRQGYRPFIEGPFINLPDAFDDYVDRDDSSVDGVNLYRASAAHAAAHMIYSRFDAESEGASKLQQTFIGLMEDARVETLAGEDFPGLAPLWTRIARIAVNRHEETDPDRVGPLLDRLALALLDPDYRDDHPLVEQARTAATTIREDLDDYERVRSAGLALAERVEAMGLHFSPSQDVPSIPYRDDNTFLFEKPESALDVQREDGLEDKRRQVTLMEMLNALDIEYISAEDAAEIWVLGTELYDDDGRTYSEIFADDRTASPVHYHEWDYMSQLERPYWTTINEKRPVDGDPETIDAILERHKPLVRRLKYLIEGIQPQGVVREKKVEDGDQIDLNAAVNAMIDIRMGQTPDPRIGIRTRLQIRDLSVMLLIDLSESTNDVLGKGEDETTVLDLAREAATLLADAIHRVGDPFAIHGFDSNGRHDVEYYRFKDFGEPYGDKAKARLAGMTGQLSTRMGAALRHAGSVMKRRPSQRKLVLLLSDGEPSDNDVRDPQYLRHDTKKAVEELHRQGVETFCVTLDPNADDYVSRVFGPKNFMVLDHVSRLPEKLPALYLSMTR
ncbi:MAG: VWA domain-containing protein [Halothiobacillaceae bacterium]|nr:VWA domain-containing protein [Halothiobacillaceae bacterium]HER35123.1 VWA domain-containing protein [Halothiobacillaceae bacterium]